MERRLEIGHGLFKVGGGRNESMVFFGSVDIGKFPIRDKFLAPSGCGGRANRLVHEVMWEFRDLKDAKVDHGIIVPFNGFANGRVRDFEGEELTHASQGAVVGSGFKEVQEGVRVASVTDNVKGFGSEFKLVVLFVNFSCFNLEWGDIGVEVIVASVHLDDFRVESGRVDPL